MLQNQFLPAIIKRFKTYKDLGDKTFEQLKDEDFGYEPAPGINSIAVIVQHMYGNAMSRWTNFLTEDGEKEWRKRDAEFEPAALTKQEVGSFWNAFWKLLFDTLNSLTPEDLEKTVYIRSEPLIAFDAILRQLAHYSYHVGQIVYIGKAIKSGDWESLSIQPGKSNEFNQNMKAR